jgi:hypothetical protein
MPVWKSAAHAVMYDPSAVKHPEPLQTVKTARYVARVRSERGYSATSYDASPVKIAKVLRRQFEQKYDVKQVRNRVSGDLATSC